MSRHHRMLALALSASVVIAAIIGRAEIREFHPVTDEMLASPSPNDWLSWRGTTKSLGFSPLDQINRGNIGQLQVAWAWNMEPGTQEAAPIVHDGVMYLANPGGAVQALDAATGDLLWEYKPKVPAGETLASGALRGVGIYADKVFVSIPDGRLVALDARTGKEVWATRQDNGFRSSTAPVITKGGKVVTAAINCSRFIEEKCALVGYDAITGKQLWRTPTIPKPGDPGSETWGDMPYLYRAGTEMWISGSYDPALNLVYWGTSQAKPWTRAGRGTDGDALYSNSTLAINPDTGAIVWYRQTLPGETHDMDEVFENVLVDVGPRQSLFKMGKMSILWEIDRRTGTILHATDLGLQNLVDLNPETGAVKYKANMVPKLDEPIDFCPSPLGGKDWPAMAYSPQNHALYVSVMNTCSTMTYRPVEKKPGGGGPGFGPVAFRVDSRANGNVGTLLAIDLDGKVLWRHNQRAPFVSSTLVTAGGLLFVADYTRYMYAFDVSTGKILWQTRLATSGHGFPLSYAVNGRQYIAMPIGVGTPWIDTYGKELMPDIPPARPGNAIVVFSLPSRATQ